ncbi:MAG: lipoate--protein ligase family protein [Treponema sp.]|jgi:lipoate-protein ligase A|nr:lipoate--protein ligase family protein [Treponema sp.]
MDKHRFRLLATAFHDGYYNMGLDEALLESVASGSSPPVLRLYGWSPPAVSVGYFQGLTEEVDLDSAKRFGFDLVRRISGGGAVLHKSELTYSIIMKTDHPLAGKELEDSYRTLCGGLIGGLGILGVESVFSGINDILVPSPAPESSGGKKISGNAQTRRMGCLLQHGTILLDNDVEVMFEVLKVPAEKIKGKLIGEVRERVTSLRDVLGREVPFEEAAAAFARGFEEKLGLEYERTGLFPEEDRRALELAREKFSSREWLFKK